MTDGGFNFAVEGGYMLKALEEQLDIIFSMTYTNQIERYLDFTDLKVKVGTTPLIVETSLASVFFNRRLFFSLTEISDIYIDEPGGYILKMIPVAEYSLFPFLAIRAGAEYSHMDQSGEFSLGYGALTGISIKFWKIEINSNFSIRKIPVKLLPGYSLSDWSLFFGCTFNPAIKSR